MKVIQIGKVLSIALLILLVAPVTSFCMEQGTEHGRWVSETSTEYAPWFVFGLLPNKVIEHKRYIPETSVDQICRYARTAGYYIVRSGKYLVVLAKNNPWIAGGVVVCSVGVAAAYVIGKKVGKTQVSK